MNNRLPDNPLPMLFAARQRRSQKWTRLASVGLSLFYAAAILLLSRGVEHEGLLSLTAVVCIYAICQMGSTIWNCSSTMVSLVGGGGFGELMLTGIGSFQVLDSAAAFYARRWLNFTPLMSGVALICGPYEPVWSVLTTVVWLASLPLGLCAVYCQHLMHLAMAGLLSKGRVVSWGLITYLSGCLGMSIFTQTAIACPTCPTLSRLSMAGMLVFMVAWAALSTLWARKIAAQGMEPSHSAPITVDRGRSGWWDRTWSNNPLVFRYVRTRARWRGLPAWVWISGSLSILGILLSLAEPGAGLALALYTMMLHGMVACMAHINFLYQETLKKNMDSLIGAMEARELVDGLAQVAYLPRLPELLLATLPVMAVDAMLNLSTVAIWALPGVVGVSLFLALMLVINLLSTYINVLFAVAVHRRSLPAWVIFAAPAFTYMSFIALGMLGIVMTSALNPDGDMGTGTWLMFTFGSGSALCTYAARQRALKNVRG